MEDFLMVGLRVLEGVDRERFQQQFGISMDEVFAAPLNKMVSAGLLDVTEEGYRLSSKGILFGNDVFAEFIGSLSAN